MSDFEIAFTDEAENLPAVKEVDEGLQPHNVDEMLMEIRNQPNWRITADVEADYYDGNQLDQETLDLYAERGQAPLIENLIKPMIDVVLGMEAKTRTDWKVRPGDESDEDMTEDVADALSVRLHRAEVESRADRACSDAYAPQIKVGLGFVEVSRESDPFKPQYRVKAVHRRELWWDWHAQEPDLSDARYMIRRKWYDADVVKAAFPQHKDVINRLMGGVSSMDVLLNGSTGLNRALDVLRGSSIEQYEYMNVQRKRVCVYEIWFKKMESGHTMRLPNGRVVEFDRSNPKHCDAVMSGMLEVKPAMFLKMRCAYTIGAFKLYEGPTPYRHQHYPYVPFFGFREDRTSVPYGLIRQKKSPQDEVNARKSKMYHLLNSRRVVADGDAVKDHNKAAQEVARPDAYIMLNENRKPSSKFEVQDGGQLAQQQFQVMQDAKHAITGDFQTLMGQTGAVTAGSAINSLLEQSSSMLGEINDNYRFSRRMVGELLLELVKEDLEGKQMRVKIEDGIDERVIELNVPGTDPETGQPTIINDVSKANVVVALDDVQQSATFRQQQYSQLVELTKSLPPQVQGLIVDFVIEASDQPNKKKMADRIRKATGIQDDSGQNSPQAQQAAAQIQQQEQQLQQLMAQLQEAQRAVADKTEDRALKSRELDIKQRADALQARIDAENTILKREEMNRGILDKSPSATQLPTIQARAKGGDVNAGQPYLVGEKGAELVIPKESGTVIPANITDMILKNTGAPVPPAPTQQDPDYDYAGYIAKHGTPDQSKGQHLTDEYKLPNHITFSDQSRYHSQAQDGGKWQQGGSGQWNFTPSAYNLSQHSPEEYKAYFSQYERKGTTITLPDGSVVEGSK